MIFPVKLPHPTACGTQNHCWIAVRNRARCVIARFSLSYHASSKLLSHYAGWQQQQ